MPAAPAVSTSTRDLQLLVRSLRGLEDQKELKKILTTAMRTGGKPMLVAARKGALAIPVTSGEKPKKGPGLRRSISKATKMQVRTGRGAGVVIRVDPRKMPPKQNNLPAYMEGRAPFQRWKHPIYGSEARVTQPPNPYFFKAIQAHQAPALHALEDAMDTVRRRLET